MSVKDPIEDLFRDNQHGLDERPHASIWDRIDEKLEEKTIASKKNNWSKYAVAACLVAGLSFASYIFLYDSNLPVRQNQKSEIVHQPMEITQKNASEILDKIEKEKQSIVTTEKNKDAPEIYKVKELKPEVIPAPKAEIYYDMAPAATMAYEAPVMKKAETEMYSADQEKMEDASIVFRGETPEKKDKNVITSKGVDTRRMGNMAESSVMYESDSAPANQISIPVKNSLVQYDLVSQTDSSVVFKNGNVNYPNQIILIQTNDSVRIIYSGKENKKNSKESQNIQKYIRENKSQIASDFGLK